MMTLPSRKALLEKIHQLVAVNPILTPGMQEEINQFVETADDQTLAAILRGLVIEDQTRAETLHQSAQAMHTFAAKIKSENEQIFQQVNELIEQAEASASATSSLKS